MTDCEQRQLTPDSVLANGSNSGAKFVLSEKHLRKSFYFNKGSLALLITSKTFVKLRQHFWFQILWVLQKLVKN